MIGGGDGVGIFEGWLEVGIPEDWLERAYVVIIPEDSQTIAAAICEGLGCIYL